MQPLPLSLQPLMPLRFSRFQLQIKRSRLQLQCPLQLQRYHQQ